MSPRASAWVCVVNLLPVPALSAPRRATLRLGATATVSALLLAFACTGCGGGEPLPAQMSEADAVRVEQARADEVISVEVTPLSGGHDAIETAVGIVDGVQIAQGLAGDAPVLLRGPDAALLDGVARRLLGRGAREVVRVVR